MDFPFPCVNSFEELARTDPNKLMEWIKSGELTSSQLTFALEILGAFAENTPKTIALLVDHLYHDSPLVREGAVTGLSEIEDETVHQVLLLRLDRETSQGVRVALLEALE